MTPFSSLRRVLAALSIVGLLLAPLSSALAADERSNGLFMVKKAKGIPANPPKKKVKGIPANPKPEVSSGELTEEEKKMVEQISQRAPVAPSAPRQKVELPAYVLAARTPVVPQTRAPQAPSLPLGDPNVLLRRIPQAPKVITPPVTMVDAPGGTDPTKKKR